MRSTKVGRWALLASCSLLLFVLSVLGTRLAHSQESFPAFTAAVRHELIRPDGSRVISELFVHAQRADGSVADVRRKVAPDGRTVVSAEILDLSTRRRTILNGATHSKSTVAVSDEEVRTHRFLKTACGSSPAHAATVLGYRVFRNRFASPVPGPRGQERWEAKDLSCYPLRTLDVKSDIRGSETSRDVTEVLGVTEGAPSENLFAIPPEYAERSPSEISSEYSRRFGKRIAAPDVLERLDKNYRAHRP